MVVQQVFDGPGHFLMPARSGSFLLAKQKLTQSRPKFEHKKIHLYSKKYWPIREFYNCELTAMN